MASSQTMASQLPLALPCDPRVSQTTHTLGQSKPHDRTPFSGANCIPASPGQSSVLCLGLSVTDYKAELVKGACVHVYVAHMGVYACVVCVPACVCTCIRGYAWGRCMCACMLHACVDVVCLPGEMKLFPSACNTISESQGRGSMASKLHLPHDAPVPWAALPTSPGPRSSAPPYSSSSNTINTIIPVAY